MTFTQKHSTNKFLLGWEKKVKNNSGQERKGMRIRKNWRKKKRKGEKTLRKEKYSNLRSSLLQCDTRPNEWGTQ